MLTILVVLAILLQVVIAIGVYFRRGDNRGNLIFMFMCLAIAAWALTDYIAISIPQNNEVIYAIRTVLSFVVVQNTLFYFFARGFLRKQERGAKLGLRHKTLIAYSVFTLLLTQSSFLFTSITIKNGSASPNPGPVIGFFILHALITIAYGLTTLWRRRMAVDVQHRPQLSLILFASVVLLVFVPVTNFVVPLVQHSTVFVKFSPFYTLIFGSIITYAIIAQKLFDIRAAVARSVAYVLIIASMTLIYGLALFGIVDILFKGPSEEFLRQVLSVILVTPLALSFQHIQSFFDRATNRLFYRNAYDSQKVLDKLGNVVVAEIDLQKVLNGSRRILSDALRPSYIEFVLVRNGEFDFEAFSKIKRMDSIVELNHRLMAQHQELLIADEVTSEQLRNKLKDAKVAVSLRLKTQQQVVGYVVFGEKRSGDVYSLQDKQLLTIVADELAVAIQNAVHIEEIQNFNLTLQQRIADATRQLRSTNDKLKELDETKDDFISMASHQLRTPLTSVKGYISMVMEGDAGKVTPMQREMLGQAFFSSQRMVYLIADLLNVSRLKTGKFIIEPVEVDLSQIVQQELGQLQETAASRSLTLEYTKPSNFPKLMLDETKTRQVIMNFVDNAIYYTPAGGHVKVELVDNPNSIELHVVDDGIGVPKSEQPHLFTKFYRAGNARIARPDGTGLGLFMAKKVVIAQGGSIIFDSHEGKGSTFGFVFDKTHLAPQANPPAKPKRTAAASPK